MKCPRCVQFIHRSADHCPHCGFTVADADNLFGHDDVKLRLFTDAAGIFRKKERGKITEIVQRFNRQFPDLFLSVYFGAHGEISNVRQHAFWLLNRGAYEDIEIGRLNSGGVLLLVDVASKEATICWGYRAEPYLAEADTFKFLSQAHPYLLQGLYLQAVNLVARRLAVHFRKRAKQVLRDPTRFFETRITPDVPLPLRAAHDTTTVTESKEGEVR